MYKSEVFHVGLPVSVQFEFLGPTFGWGVRINDIRYLIFRLDDEEEWVPQYFKLPSWITSDEIDILFEMFLEVLKDPGVPDYAY